MNRAQLFSGALRGVAAPAGALLLFAGATLALTAAATALDYRAAVELRAVVVSKHLVRADREIQRSTRFVVRHRVELPDGTTVESDEDLERTSWEARAVGQSHPVLYLRETGTILPPVGSPGSIGPMLMGAIGAVLLVLGALLSRRPLRTLLDRYRLHQRGVAATATVADVFQTSTAVNRVILWQLRYRYRDASGVEHEAPSDLLRPDEAARWQPGATGSILYDPQRPAVSAWLGAAAGSATHAGAHAGAYAGANAGENAGAYTSASAGENASANGFAPAGPAQASTAGERRWPRTRALLRLALNVVLILAAVFVAGVIGELVPQAKQLDAWIAERRTPLAFATGGAAALGVFLLIGSVISMLMDGEGRPMSRREIEHHRRSMHDAATGPQLSRASSYRLWGAAAGSSGHDRFTIGELKRAIAGGTVLRDRVWRRRIVATCGAALMFCGLFGVFIVILPLALKLLLAAVIVYAAVRTAWAFVRAR